ncbi:hypothetical protein SELMODRAFT_236983 [Selaginella moellendorffii]|uniref:Sucrose-phosphate phosphatase n=1 Tax=Selaginella moellendorffii TaxID=88036 RepID=D8TG10_SELML|nr:hypothetical protein SELMODRAFT_236983 [Selaginella moellendorffii]
MEGARLAIVSDLDGTMVRIAMALVSSSMRSGPRIISMTCFWCGRGRCSRRRSRSCRDCTAMPWFQILDESENQTRGGIGLFGRDFQVSRAYIPAQRPHKVSFKLKKAEAPRRIVRSFCDLILFPFCSSSWMEGRAPQKVLVCGDSGNDSELFAVKDVSGVIVGNAFEDLTQWYLDNAKDNPKIFRGTERCASGILQAIREFKFDPCVSPRDADLLSQLTAGDTEGLIGPGVVESSHEVFEHLKRPMILRPLYGIHRGKNFCMGVDRIRATKVGDVTWVVKFDKWQRTGTRRAELSLDNRRVFQYEVAFLSLCLGGVIQLCFSYRMACLMRVYYESTKRGLMVMREDLWS